MVGAFRRPITRPLPIWRRCHYPQRRQVCSCARVRVSGRPGSSVAGSSSPLRVVDLLLLLAMVLVLLGAMRSWVTVAESANSLEVSQVVLHVRRRHRYALPTWTTRRGCRSAKKAKRGPRKVAKTTGPPTRRIHCAAGTSRRLSPRSRSKSARYPETLVWPCLSCDLELFTTLGHGPSQKGRHGRRRRPQKVCRSICRGSISQKLTVRP